jgi:ribonuclease P protein component
VLARQNRIVAAADFKRLVRSGRRARGPLTLTYARRTAAGDPLRVGVVVARSVGKAVVRNRVRRRIRAASWQLAREVDGLDVVVRALPAAAGADWPALSAAVRGQVLSLAGRG